MIYITDCSFSLLIYHLKKEYDVVASLVETDNIKEFKEVLIRSATLNEDLTAIIPAINIVKWEGKPPKLDNIEQASNNIVYIIVDSINKEWKLLIEKESIQYISVSPLLYKKEVEAVRGLFTQDAFNYFWEELCLSKFKGIPNKWRAELQYLIILRKDSKEKITLQELEDHYSMVKEDLFNKYLLSIGIKDSTNLIYQMNDSQLWKLFIGSEERPPAIKRYLLDKDRGIELYYLVTQLQSAVLNNTVDLKIGCLILNYFIEELKPNKLKVSYSIEEVKRLKQLLNLI